MNIPERIGYKKEFRSILLTNDYKLIKHKDTMVDRYLKLAGATFTNSLRHHLKINLDKAKECKDKFLLHNLNKNYPNKFDKCYFVLCCCNLLNYILYCLLLTHDMLGLLWVFFYIDW